VGDTIVWTNHDLVPHTATAAGGGWDTGALAQNATGQWIATAGIHPYVCAYHPTMRGVIQVE
jgi:plastocyanin